MRRSGVIHRGWCTAGEVGTASAPGPAVRPNPRRTIALSSKGVIAPEAAPGAGRAGVSRTTGQRTVGRTLAPPCAWRGREVVGLNDARRPGFRVEAVQVGA